MFIGSLLEMERFSPLGCSNFRIVTINKSAFSSHRFPSTIQTLLTGPLFSEP